MKTHDVKTIRELEAERDTALKRADVAADALQKYIEYTDKLELRRDLEREYHSRAMERTYRAENKAESVRRTYKKLKSRYDKLKAKKP